MNDTSSAPAELDVVGIGNALVDVISQEGDDFVDRLGVPKGAMTLIDEQRATEIYDAMGAAIEVSGGSAANTIVGVAALGGRAQYLGKVRNDQLGAVFADVRRGKALASVVDRVNVTDSTGAAVDTSELFGSPSDTEEPAAGFGA